MADSILLLYDTTRPETFDNLTNEWLPLLRDIQESRSLSTTSNSPHVANNAASPEAFDGSAGSAKMVPFQKQDSKQCCFYRPVIIVGTKIDLLVDGEDMSKHIPVLATYSFVVVGLICSSAKLQDVDQVFYFGEQAVTFPLYPLFDVVSQEFTPACRRAFRRIFRVFDVDNDNLLNDAEIIELQLKCFDVSINTEELLTLKRLISRNVPGGLSEKCFTFEGFLGLIKMYVDINSCQIPWTILRRFHYEDDLSLVVMEEFF